MSFFSEFNSLILVSFASHRFEIIHSVFVKNSVNSVNSLCIWWFPPHTHTYFASTHTQPYHHHLSLFCTRLSGNDRFGCFVVFSLLFSPNRFLLSFLLFSFSFLVFDFLSLFFLILTMWSFLSTNFSFPHSNSHSLHPEFCVFRVLHILYIFFLSSIDFIYATISHCLFGYVHRPVRTRVWVAISLMY